MTKTRSPDDVRKRAREHFDGIARHPALFQMTPEQAEEHIRVGMGIVEAGLSLPEDGVFDLSEWLAGQVNCEERTRVAFATMPFLMGHARLFSMEFTHAEIGLVPIDEVRRLIESGKDREYKGTTLTMDTVCMQYRRLAL